MIIVILSLLSLTLYRNIKQNVSSLALKDALSFCTNFVPKSIQSFVDFVMFILDSVLVQFGINCFKQNDGIITRDNHSVSLHSVTKPAFLFIKQAHIYKRFIDDIVWISSGQQKTDSIITAIINAFAAADLKLTFQIFNT